jgi:glycosyltransferase involved in cell wall biosynthesis
VKIAVVAPVEELVPPRTYGGIERVVQLLDRELASRGHDVVLFASGGSASADRLVPLTAGPLGRDAGEEDKNRAMRTAADLLESERPDVVLSHSWRLLDYSANLAAPVLTTVHYPLDRGRYRSIFLSRPHGSYVSVSLSQQAAAPLRFVANVYNGIDVGRLPFSAHAGGYLAFLGRFSADKGPDIAIRVAQAVGLPLKVAAKLDTAQRPWFEEVVAPLVRRGGVELVGELSSAERGPFLAGAAALLHPSRWSEPFGLAAVEAMACGTPVLALRRGAAPEVVVDGETGFVASDERGLVAAARQVATLDRPACRAHVDARFSYVRMAGDYEALALAARDERRV